MCVCVWGERGQREWGVGDVEGWRELRNFHVSLMLSLKIVLCISSSV